MDNEQLLQELRAKIQSGEISSTELSRVDQSIPMQGAPVSQEHVPAHRATLSKVLYALGAAIVAIGIMIFVGQIWEDLGAAGHIAITLGLGLLFAMIGSSLLVSGTKANIGAVFHAIGGMLIPGGALVMLYEIGLLESSVWPTTIIFGILAVCYFLLMAVHKHAVLTFFAVANGTMFLYAFATAIMDGRYRHLDDVYTYLTILVGLSYLLFARAIDGTWNQSLKRVFEVVGAFCFLGATYSRMFDSVFWELLYVVILGGMFALSVFARSRRILFISTIFTISYVAYITGEYFADSLGWPLALVLLGFIFIGLGYFSISINRKYISGSATPL